MGRGRQVWHRLPAVLGFGPPDLNGPGDMAQVIFGLVAEIDEGRKPGSCLSMRFFNSSAWIKTWGLA